MVDDVELRPGATRRQLTVLRRPPLRAVPALCLQRLTRPGILRQLVHRAGMDADVLTSDGICVGYSIVRTDQGDNT